MAFEVDSRGRPIYYDDRTYSQADFNELLRQLAASEPISKIDVGLIQDDLDFRERYAAAQRAMGDNPMDWSIQQEAAQRYGRGGQFAVLPDGPGTGFQKVTDPQTGETYYTRRLMSGGPGDRDNTFRLDPSMGVRENQDWYLQAIYNPDGTLREIAPIERPNTSGWVDFRDAIKPVLAMAGLAAGGGWLANALGAGAAGAAGLAEGTYAAGVVPSGAALGAGGAAAGAAGAAGGLGTAAGAAAGATTLGSLLSNPAVIGGGLSLVGGAMGADAARDAARAQEASANAAIEEVRRQYDQNRADQMPWLQAGQQTLGDLLGRLDSLTTPYTQADFQSDPGYQFELAEGQRALDAAARARGLYGSSGSLRELLRYSQGLASTRYQDAFNRDLTNRQNTYNMLSGISGTGQVTAGNLGSMGQNTANTVGSLLTQTGNAQAAGRIGAANAWTNAGSQALNAWQQQMLLDRIGSNLYR